MKEVAAIAMAVNASKTRSLFYDKIKFTEESSTQLDRQGLEPEPGET